MKAQRLTGKSGKQVAAVVTYHAPIHATGTTACGVPFQTLREIDVPVEQVSGAVDLSDVNCPLCVASQMDPKVIEMVQGWIKLYRFDLDRTARFITRELRIGGLQEARLWVQAAAAVLP